MQTTIYSDGIANITMLEGVVRFDLMNITQLDEDKRTVKTVGAAAKSVPALGLPVSDGYQQTFDFANS